MKLLVTGGAGYIGSTLVPALLGAGHEVTVLDTFAFKQMPFNGFCGDPRFDVVRGDARDARLVKPLLAHADALLPLAALVGAPLCDADIEGAVSLNVEAVRMALLHMSAEQRVVIPITNSGYGIGEPGVECTEDSPLRPISLYGRTKVQAEAIALERENAISLRLATVFGMSPRMRVDLLVNDFVLRAITDRAIVLFEAHFKRNFIHVLDVAEAFLLALVRFDEMRGRPYNVGLSDANLSKLELCERIAARVPFTYVEAPVGEDPDKRDYVVSNARIEAVGFRPKVSLDAGIDELVKGYRMLRNGTHGNA